MKQMKQIKSYLLNGRLVTWEEGEDMISRTRDVPGERVLITQMQGGMVQSQELIADDELSVSLGKELGQLAKVTNINDITVRYTDGSTLIIAKLL